ncbi:hypothetical protein BC827DRAFT_1209471 [Russula dissimulans]|nr:hypothetical protein BC827DRAFT_1209471 [Russula dissimulans]
MVPFRPASCVLSFLFQELCSVLIEGPRGGLGGVTLFSFIAQHGNRMACIMGCCRLRWGPARGIDGIITPVGRACAIAIQISLVPVVSTPYGCIRDVM